jgi:extracellular elastinolytic metalloproteinase
VNPRPAAPDLILRRFDVPDTLATHVRIRVLANQCTGNPAPQLGTRGQGSREP